MVFDSCSLMIFLVDSRIVAAGDNSFRALKEHVVPVVSCCFRDDNHIPQPTSRSVSPASLAGLEDLHRPGCSERNHPTKSCTWCLKALVLAWVF